MVYRSIEPQMIRLCQCTLADCLVRQRSVVEPVEHGSKLASPSTIPRTLAQNMADGLLFTAVLTGCGYRVRREAYKINISRILSVTPADQIMWHKTKAYGFVITNFLVGRPLARYDLMHSSRTNARRAYSDRWHALSGP